MEFIKGDFANGFADFLEERLGKVLFALRESNEDYRELSDKYAALLNGKYQSVEDYKIALSKIADVGRKCGDIQKHYLFLADMREHANIKDVISSEDFEKLFTDIE